MFSCFYQTGGNPHLVFIKQRSYQFVEREKREEPIINLIHYYLRENTMTVPTKFVIYSLIMTLL